MEGSSNVNSSSFAEQNRVRAAASEEGEEGEEAGARPGVSIFIPFFTMEDFRNGKAVNHQWHLNTLSCLPPYVQHFYDELPAIDCKWPGRLASLTRLLTCGRLWSGKRTGCRAP